MRPSKRLPAPGWGAYPCRPRHARHPQQLSLRGGPAACRARTGALFGSAARKRSGSAAAAAAGAGDAAGTAYDGCAAAGAHRGQPAPHPRLSGAVRGCAGGWSALRTFCVSHHEKRADPAW
eukprot:1036056-Pelagomonas_calceolata.AAC.3